MIVATLHHPNLPKPSDMLMKSDGVQGYWKLDADMRDKILDYALDMKIGPTKPGLSRERIALSMPTLRTRDTFCYLALLDARGQEKRGKTELVDLMERFFNVPLRIAHGSESSFIVPGPSSLSDFVTEGGKVDKIMELRRAMACVPPWKWSGSDGDSLYMTRVEFVKRLKAYFYDVVGCTLEGDNSDKNETLETILDFYADRPKDMLDIEDHRAINKAFGLLKQRFTGWAGQRCQSDPAYLSLVEELGRLPGDVVYTDCAKESRWKIIRASCKACEVDPEDKGLKYLVIQAFLALAIHDYAAVSGQIQYKRVDDALKVYRNKDSQRPGVPSVPAASAVPDPSSLSRSDISVLYGTGNAGNDPLIETKSQTDSKDTLKSYMAANDGSTVKRWKAQADALAAAVPMYHPTDRGDRVLMKRAGESRERESASIERQESQESRASDTRPPAPPTTVVAPDMRDGSKPPGPLPCFDRPCSPLRAQAQPFYPRACRPAASPAPGIGLGFPFAQAPQSVAPAPGSLQGGPLQGLTLHFGEFSLNVSVVPKNS